jgi:rRNA maturation endonuclease Nob1
MTEAKPEECLACPLGPPDWQYVCHHCKAEFTMPVPKGPTEEKSRVCPQCGKANIIRIKSAKTEACPPGG